MTRVSLLIAATLGATLSIGALDAATPLLSHSENESDLMARIEREQDAVKKAKYQMRLGELKLEQATEAYDGSDLEQGQKLLDGGLKWMSAAWATLKNSGRDASRHSGGFKELDIALRESGRRLEDLKHRVSFMDRDPLEHATHEIDALHNQVLTALFPGAKSP